MQIKGFYKMKETRRNDDPYKLTSQQNIYFNPNFTILSLKMVYPARSVSNDFGSRYPSPKCHRFIN